MTCALSAPESGASARRSTCSHAGRFSSTSGRATQRRSAGASSAVVDDVVDQVEQRRLGPVQILEDEHERPAARQRLDELARCPEHLGKRVLLLREADGGSEPLEHLLVALAQEPRELGARGREIVGVLDSRRFPERLDERPERDPVAVGEASAADDERALRGRFANVLDEPGLADAGVARDEHARAGARLDRAVERSRDLLRLASRGRRAATARPR